MQELVRLSHTMNHSTHLRLLFQPVAGLSVLFVALAGAALAQEVPTPGSGSPERHSDVRITGHIFKPAELPPPALDQLKVPEGFRVERFAENLGNARILAIGPEGRVYVTRRDQGHVLMLKPGSNGLAEGPAQRVASRAGTHGITFDSGKVYIATVHEIFRADVLKDGTFGPLEMIVHDLPDAGQHHTRTVQFGPDGMIYSSVASTGNECNETNPENATMLQLSPHGKKRMIYAAGLRDTIGWGWHPETGKLWAMDHGIDWLGDDVQPEELALDRMLDLPPGADRADVLAAIKGHVLAKGDLTGKFQRPDKTAKP